MEKNRFLRSYNSESFIFFGSSSIETHKIIIMTYFTSFQFFNYKIKARILSLPPRSHVPKKWRSWPSLPCPCPEKRTFDFWPIFAL